MRYCRLTADGSFDIYADDNADKLLESVPLLDTLVTFEEGECCCHAQFTIADKLKGLSTRIGITVITCRDRNNELVREWAEAISRLDGVETVHAHDDGDGADEEEPASPPALSKLASRAQSSASVVSGSTGAYGLPQRVFDRRGGQYWRAVVAGRPAFKARRPSLRESEVRLVASIHLS